MRAAGLRDVREEPFTIPAYLPQDAGCVIAGARGVVDDVALRCAGLQSTAVGEVRCPAVWVGDATEAELAAAGPLEHRVAVTGAGLLFGVAERLAAHGAAALVHVGSAAGDRLAHHTTAFWPHPVRARWAQRVAPLPGVSITAAGGRALRTALDRGPVIVTITHAARYEERTTANVIGELGGRDSLAGPVIVGAHHDTQRDSPGASDNATGLAALLAIARDWAVEPPGAARFVAFGAEESGAWGATHHVAGLEVPTVAGMVNLDALGPPVDARRTLIATSDIVEGALARAAATGWHPEATIDATTFPFTDHAPFAAAGIPTALLWRWPPPHPTYHSAGDTPELVDGDRLREDATAAEAVARWLTERAEKCPTHHAGKV